LKRTLKSKLVDFLIEEPKHLQEVYDAFPEECPDTIRGRLNENINKCFKRISRGVYIATIGDCKALIIEGDAWDAIKDIQDNSIDAIITDSGYTCLNDFLATGTTRKKINKWEFPTKDIDQELLKEMFRVLKPSGHFFSFLPADSKKTLDYNNNFIEMAKKAGFEFNKRFIWDKQVIGMGYNGRAKYEQMIFLSKGKRHMPYDKSIPDLLSHKRINPNIRLHEAEKPVELIEDLLKFCSQEGDVILDPFAGTLSLAKACLKQKRNAICMDISHKIIDIALSSLKEFGKVEAI